VTWSADVAQSDGYLTGRYFAHKESGEILMRPVNLPVAS